jgi:hypothetical protein
MKRNVLWTIWATLLTLMIILMIIRAHIKPN